MVKQGVSIEITGLESVKAKLLDVNSSLSINVNKAIMDGGFLVERDAKKRCPVDTGRLRSSINTRKTGNLEVTVMDGVDYGKFIEYGTSKMRAQPFMRPAANAQKPAIISLVNLAVKRST